MRTRLSAPALLLLASAVLLGCGSDEARRVGSPDPSDHGRSATILGRLSAAGAPATGMPDFAKSGCPKVEVTLNGSPVQIRVDDDCSFAISDVQPAESVVLGIGLPELGIHGTIEFQDVADGELIEISVVVRTNSMSISVVRRDVPRFADALPAIVEGNNVTIMVDAGLFDQDLMVFGNNFTLVGRAGIDCHDDGWTVLDGSVVIRGNNAIFRNIAFEGPVEVRGNNARFVNCCVNGQLLLFGNDFDLRGEDDDEDHDDDEDDEDDGGGEEDD